jgi:hypothetical protein
VEVLGQQQVAGGRDREELGHPFDDAQQEDRDSVRHRTEE